MKIFRVWFKEENKYMYLEFTKLEKATDVYMEKIENGSESVYLEICERLLTYSK